MPQLLFLALVGTGLYTGMRWAAGVLAAQAEAAANQADEIRRRAEAEAGRLVPKDLGALEWDATAGVYRPKIS